MTILVFGTFVGVLCFGSILLTQLPAQRIGFIFGWSPSLVGGMLALAVALPGMSAAMYRLPPCWRRRSLASNQEDGE